MAELTLTFSVI